MHRFTPAQAAMIKASEPSDRDPNDGTGVERRGAGMFAVARILEQHDLGVTKDGHPRHPPYVGYDVPFQPWGPR